MVLNLSLRPVDTAPNEYEAGVDIELAGKLQHLGHLYLSSRVRAGEIATSTLSGMRSSVAFFVALHGNRAISQISQNTMRRWLEQRSHLKASTLSTQWSHVSGFLAWLVEEGHLRRNPCAAMKAPRRPRTEPRTIEPDDIHPLLAVAPDARARAIIMMEWGMGARRVEVHRANVEDWSRRAGEMRLVGKGGHERIVAVPDDVARAFTCYLDEHPATVGPFFRTYHARPRRLSVSTIGHYVADWMLEAGVKHAPHDGLSGHSLRRTCASELLDESGDIRVVQEVLGHAHLSSSAPYLRRMNRLRMRDAMEARRIA